MVPVGLRTLETTDKIHRVALDLVSKSHHTIGRVGANGITTASLRGSLVFEDIKERSLYCECATFKSSLWKWCGHLESMMVHGWDAETWTLGGHPDGPFKIPLFRHGAVVDVWVELSGEVHDLWEADLLVEDGEGKGRRRFQIGYIDSHEGRGAIRELVLEFVYAKYKMVPACSSDSHGDYDFGLQDERKRDGTNPDVVRDVLSILGTGECWGCLNLMDDVVPDI